MNSLPALLVLEDGRSFLGRSFGAEGEAFGELVFSTGMSGYQETLTDPSYRGQVVLATAPHIGNTGWNDEDDESARIQVAGYVVRDPAPRPSNWRSRRSLDAELADQGIVGICDIDTRALTRHIRSLGAMRVGISTRELNPDRLRARVLEQPVMAGADLCGEVSTPKARIVPAVGERRFTVAAVDLGIKGMTPAQMAGRGMEVHVLPASTSFEEIAALEPDGVFFSNGPGDPDMCNDAVEIIRKQMNRSKKPICGICMGNQLLSKAAGATIYKLKYGHRGHNQPVRMVGTEKCYITSQNHGYAVDASTLDKDWRELFVNMNDGSNEGICHKENPWFTSQFHPEACSGPVDTYFMFDKFVETLK